MMPRVLSALRFASIQHREQRRKGSGEPYVNHLIEVAELLVTVGQVDDEDIIIAGVLHDVVEDTNTSFEQLVELFGERVAGFVDEVTDDKNLDWMQRKQQQIRRVATASFGAKTIKLADHSSNVATLPEQWIVERRLHYLDWSAQVISGCTGINPRLEELYRERASAARRVFEREVNTR